jgi:DNA-binding PadR family transcriptional regulator
LNDPLSKMTPQGAPRGFLVYWMLHRISRSPTHGYEILREIEQKTEGAWRPGPGSVYPLLRRLESQGYVASETAGDGAELRKYKITRKGVKHIQETREMFRTMHKRWSLFRTMFVDLIEPSDVAHFLIEGSKRNFDLARHVVEANRSQLSPDELGRMLREYSLMLEGQQSWVSGLLSEIRPLQAHRRGVR